MRVLCPISRQYFYQYVISPKDSDAGALFYSIATLKFCSPLADGKATDQATVRAVASGKVITLINGLIELESAGNSFFRCIRTLSPELTDSSAICRQPRLDTLEVRAD